MAFSTGGHGGAVSEINVTPMIDILLVLLIIFMAITPISPKGLDALVPQPPKNQQKEIGRTIVVSITHRPGGGEPAYKINEDDYAKSALEAKLAEIFSTRAEKVMFVRSDPQVDFAAVAEVIDMGHQAAVDHIGLITPKVAAGQ